MGDLVDAARKRREALHRYDQFEPSSESPGQPAPTYGDTRIQGGMRESQRVGMNELARIGLPMAGGTAGAAAAGLVGLPPSVGAVPGAAAGGYLYGKVSGEDPTREALFGAAGEGAGRALGHVVGPHVGRGVNWLAERIAPHAPRVARALGRTMRAAGVETGAAEAQKMLTARGATLTAGQASTSSTIDMLENIAEKAVLARPKIVGTRESAQAVARSYLDDYVSAFGLTGTREQRGAAIQSALEGLADNHNAMVGKLFDQVDDQLGSAIVDRRQMLLTAQQIRDGIKLRKTAAAAKIGTILDDVLSDPSPTMTFRDAQAWRSELLDALRDLPTSGDLMKGKAVAWARQLEASITQSMEEAGARTSGPAKQLWEDARALYRMGHEQFNNDFVNAMVRKETPEVLFQNAVKPGRPSDIARVRKALLSPPRVEGVENLSAVEGRAAWQTIQGTAIEDIVGRARDPISGQISGEQLLKTINRYGDDVGRELFGASGFDPLKRIARTLFLTQKTAGGAGTGSVAIQLLQPGAAIQLGTAATGQAVGGGIGTGLATTVLLAPAGLARALADPTFVDYFSRGLRTPLGTKASTRAIGQIIGRLGELGLMDQAPAPPKQEEATPPQKTIDDVTAKRIMEKLGMAPGGM
jgi:hypothetical protein